ncbi:MAG TPA: MFS transporter [Dehalococcoidia bacterium]|nr:MFS transporter [Dehalococcoidia bacterium]
MVVLKRPRFKLFYGWYIVGACFLISVYSSGIVHLGFTAIIEPIVEEFQWSYALVSFAASIRGFETGLMAPLVGWLFHRWGPRKLLIAGGILTGLGLLLLGRTNSLAMYYGSFVLITMGVSTHFGVLPMTVAGNWFRKRVSLATGVIVSGAAVGGVLVPLVTIVIDTYLWRTAMTIFGLGALAIILPLASVVRHRPEQYGYLPDGEVSKTVDVDEVQIAAQYQDVEASLKQALKSRAFWHISIGLMLHFITLVAVVTHVMPYLSSLGIPRATSSLVAMAIPLVTIFGRLSFGWFGDRFDKRRVTAFGLALLCSSMLMFYYVGVTGPWLLVLFIAFFGVGYGGPIPMAAALIREYYGRANMGTILGISTGIVYAGGVAGPPLAGWVYDTYGSYQGAWFILAGVAFAGMVSLLTAPSVRQYQAGGR